MKTTIHVIYPAVRTVTRKLAAFAESRDLRFNDFFRFRQKNSIDTVRAGLQHRTAPSPLGDFSQATSPLPAGKTANVRVRSHNLR